MVNDVWTLALSSEVVVPDGTCGGKFLTEDDCLDLEVFTSEGGPINVFDFDSQLPSDNGSVALPLRGRPMIFQSSTCGIVLH